MNSSPSVHSVLARVCRQITPKLNPDIMRGLATVMLARSEDYIESVARRNFHGCVPGLEFISLERCTPEEEYLETTKVRNNKRVFDFAESYIIMYKLKLGLWVDGQLRPFQDKFIYLPYVLDGGLIKLSGSLYHIKPILTNKVISPGNRSLFVRMLGTKKNFYRAGYSIKVDGVTETTFVVHSAIYEASKAGKKGAGGNMTTRAVSCMTHYLLLKYGYSETFQRYVGHVPVVGTDEEITPANYPPEDWVIISTAHTSVKPSGVIEDGGYNSTRLRLAVRRDKWNQSTRALVSELFYVIDHFPSYVTVDSMDQPNSWLFLMGYILVGGQFTAGRIFRQMQEHLTSLDDFVDEFAADKLLEKGFKVESFYDLAALLSTKFPDLQAENDRAGNIYEKYYDVLYHAMKPITYALTNTRYALQQAAKRAGPDRIKADNGALHNSLSQVLLRRLNPGAVYGLANEDSVRETVSYCGDHWYPRITSKVSEQEKVASGKGGGRRGTSDADHLDVSMIEGGSILFLPKSNPTPVANINPYANIDRKTGSIIPNPELIDLLAETKVKLDDK